MNNEIKLLDLLAYLWSRKWQIILVSGGAAALFVIYLLFLPNKYTSTTAFLAVNKESEGGLASLASSFGGVASLAGINLGGGDSAVVEAEFMLTSNSFLIDVVNKYGFLPQVVAAERYSFDTNEISYNLDDYDPVAKKWLFDDLRYSHRTKGPSEWYIATKLNEMISLSKDDLTGLLKLRVEHVSPGFAQEFSVLLISELNELMRKREAERIDNRLTFLHNQLDTSKNVEVNTAIYSLIEQQIKKKMLSDTSDDFAFRIIEKANYPEKKSSPLRAILLVVFSIVMFIGVLFLYMLLFAYQQHKQRES